MSALARRGNPYLEFGPADDWVAWAALALALIALTFASSRRGDSIVARSSPRRVVAALAASASLASFGYLAYYLRGGPRIVDATYYYLAGRALSHGDFAFEVPGPVASFAGRFLLTAPNGHALGVLFPPGYPAALALAMKLGVPLALGPALAAALVFVTYRLAMNATENTDVARVAALLSVVSAALRYHTADTMSHGLSALLLAGALTASLARGARANLLTGALSGFAVATRPVTGLVALAAALVALEKKPRSLALFAAALTPGLLLLAMHQRALTGSFFGSTQLAYYARADGPSGCFRYGFGDGIGCLFEHGDYVRARLSNGYDAYAALATTARRLLVHGLDVANFWPLALGVPLGAWLARADRRVRVLTLSVAAGVLAYAPFYFEGSFPGGGARFFADLLPIEHVLLAIALVHLRVSRFALPLALAGFALHTSAQHRLLRGREGGRPMFEARELARAGVDHGLVFVETDHGFALGFDPAVTSASAGVVVARRRHDDLDALLWQTLGRPPTYCYEYDPRGQGPGPLLKRCQPAETGPIIRVEAESLWPPSAVDGGWAHPDFLPNGCVSRGRGLRLHPNESEMELATAIPFVGSRAQIRVAWWSPERPKLWLDGLDQTQEQRASADFTSLGDGCWVSSWVDLLPEQTHGSARLRAGSGVIDWIELRPATR